MSAPVTKNVRLRLSEADWRKLRLMAEEADVSVTEMVRVIVTQGLSSKDKDKS